jgi:hypothetical protein
MDHYQLTRFEIKDAGNNNAVVLVTGSLRYKAILQRAFNQYYFSRTFEDRFGHYEWGTYIYNMDVPERERVEALLKVFQEAVCIEDDLTEAFALGYHTQMNPTGGYVRTDFGDLVYQAKPYRGDFTAKRRRVADGIAERMTQFIGCHLTYARAEIVAAVPPSATNRPNLPVYLAERLADRLGKENGTDLISKTRSTRPMKDCRTIQGKIDNVKGAFALGPQAIAKMQDCSVILLDDIYQTGFTLNEVGHVLLASGVREVLGLVATKTAQDLE